MQRMEYTTFLNRLHCTYFSSVVLVSCSDDAQMVCQKNGLLLHELLTGFCNIEDLTRNIRRSSGMYSLKSFHLRFISMEEFRPKTSEIIENTIRKTFKEAQVDNLPSSPSQIKTNTSNMSDNNITAWSPEIENVAMHSMSFNECEMVSQPLVHLHAISTGAKPSLLQKAQEVCGASSTAILMHL